MNMKILASFSSLIICRVPLPPSSRKCGLNGLSSIGHKQCFFKSTKEGYCNPLIFAVSGAPISTTLTRPQTLNTFIRVPATMYIIEVIISPGKPKIYFRPFKQVEIETPFVSSIGAYVPCSYCLQYLHFA